MKNDESLFLLQDRLERVCSASKDNLHEIQQKCVKHNRFTYPEIIGIMSGNTPINALTEPQLYWLLEYSNKLIKDLGKAEDYFTEAEILSCKFYETEAEKPLSYPITFENVTCLTPDSTDKRQFGFYLSVGDIKRYRSNNIFKVSPELQRNGKKDKYGDLKPKTNQIRRKEITKAIENGDYFYNSISIALVDDDKADWFYDEENKRITIECGDLIIPDGHHRGVACEFVDAGNAHLEDMFNVLFLVGSPSDIKRKIYQEWNTQPVTMSHKRSMKPTVSNYIVDAVKRSPDIDDIIKKNIVTTKLQVKTGEGFIIYSLLADVIDKHYNINKITTKQEQNKISDWIIKFLNNVVYMYKEDFHKFKEVRKYKWNVSPYAFIGYIMLSRYLKDDNDWENKTEHLLAEIDFSDMNQFRSSKAEKAHVRYVENIFEEVIKFETKK